MGVPASTRLPAGWYPDPDGDDQRRWWDGRTWTQYTAAFQRPTPIDEVEITAAEPLHPQVVGTRVGRWLAGATNLVSRRKHSKHRDTGSRKR